VACCCDGLLVVSGISQKVIEKSFCVFLGGSIDEAEAEKSEHICFANTAVCPKYSGVR